MHNPVIRSAAPIRTPPMFLSFEGLMGRSLLLTPFPVSEFPPLRYSDFSVCSH